MGNIPEASERLPRNENRQIDLARRTLRLARRLGPKIALNSGLMLGSLIMLFPFIWMVVGAFKPMSELTSPNPTLFPRVFTLSNFTNLLLKPFGQYFLNSLGVTLIAVTLILFTSSLLGYIFARGGFRGSKAAFFVVVASVIVPLEVTVVPLFLIVSGIGWEDSYQALIIPFMIDAFGIYLFREFMLGIPTDYFDAAKVDGATEWLMYRKIAMPQCKPIFATLAIFSFVYIWDQLLWPIVIISSDSRKTLPIGVSQLSSESGARFDLVLAAGTLAILPPLIVFFLFQRKIVQGVTMAGLKG